MRSLGRPLDPWGNPIVCLPPGEKLISSIHYLSVTIDAIVALPVVPPATALQGNARVANLADPPGTPYLCSFIDASPPAQLIVFNNATTAWNMTYLGWPRWLQVELSTFALPPTTIGTAYVRVPQVPTP